MRVEKVEIIGAGRKTLSSVKGQSGRADPPSNELRHPKWAALHVQKSSGLAGQVVSCASAGVRGTPSPRAATSLL
jgi:hypothetical protein